MAQPAPVEPKATSPPATSPRFRIVSWNVNSIRAWSVKDETGLLPKFGTLDKLFASWEADIVCFQETKVHSLTELTHLHHVKGWESFWSICKQVEGKERKGYSGVVTYAKLGITPLATVKFGIDEFDQEGRVVMTDHGAFVLFNVYLPNAGQDKKRLEYKLRFNNWFRSECDKLTKANRKVVVVGDFNVAKKVDIHPTLGNYLPEEEQWLDAMIQESGFVDSFRRLHKDVKYTWWDPKKAARSLKVGLRIDYALVHNSIPAEAIVGADIWDGLPGSDHCPITLDLNKRHVDVRKTDARAAISSETAKKKQPSITSFFAKPKPSNSTVAPKPEPPKALDSSSNSKKRGPDPTDEEPNAKRLKTSD